MKRLHILAGLLAIAVLFSACMAGPTTNDPANTTPETAAVPELEIPAETTEAPARQTTEVPAEATAEPTEAETAPETTAHVPQDGDESSAFSGIFSGCDETIYGVLYNAPFTNGEPAPTEVWNRGEYDQLVLIPRYVGTTVRAYEMELDENWQPVAKQAPVYTTVSQDGCVIGASLQRPEGAPAWYVEMELPDGRSAGMALSYNGRYGTARYEFLTDPYASSLVQTPSVMDDWAPSIERFGSDVVWAYWRAATRMGLDPWEATSEFFTELTEIGDGAAFTLREDQDMENGVYHFDAARFHTAYYTEKGTLGEAVRAQYNLYSSVGNRFGILGPDDPYRNDPLVYQLKGLTIYNPSLAAATVRIRLDHEDVGTFDLSAGDFCTLIPLDLPEFEASRPVSVDVEVLETYYGTPEEAIIQVWPGIGSNISGAL